jgi:maleate isomerase
MAAVPETAQRWANSKPRSVDLGKGRHTRGRLGFVLLETEETADDDIRRVVPDDVGVFYTRTPFDDSVTIETLAAVGDDLSRAAGVLPPDMDAIAYVCTSGSVVVGEDNVANALAKPQPQAKTTSLVTCVVEAMRALGMQKIEQRTGKPVVGSNHALIWRMMRLAGIEDRMEGLGRLYREH